MNTILKSSAKPCPICGRLLWKAWWKRTDKKGRPLGYNPGSLRNGKMVCWNGGACKKRAAEAKPSPNKVKCGAGKEAIEVKDWTDDGKVMRKVADAEANGRGVVVSPSLLRRLYEERRLLAMVAAVNPIDAMKAKALRDAILARNI